jgi:hypothetical protein
MGNQDGIYGGFKNDHLAGLEIRRISDDQGHQNQQS